MTEETVLSDLLTTESVLTPSACKELLKDDEIKLVTTIQSPFLVNRPFYVPLYQRILEWGKMGVFPLKHPKLEHCRIDTVEFERIYGLTPTIEELAQDSTNTVLWTKALNALGVSGILILLGLQRTVGTKDIFPPSIAQLIHAFNQKHSPKSQLSAGARALCKHCHRDSADTPHHFWGGQMHKGNDMAKNQCAEAILMKILNHASWVNIHTIVHQVPLLEVRVADGHGSRWEADGKTFRGFVEPQMADGHLKGWRH